MIIILGPDHTGKTTLAKRLAEARGRGYFHYTKDSTYQDYIKDMCALNWWNGVLDRHAMCEYSYATVMERPARFSMKEWHNILLTTLIQNPLIVLCVNKPTQHEYSAGQYLPYSKWDECLRLYRQFLSTHQIPYMTYDYSNGGNPVIELMLNHARSQSEAMEWWVPMWKAKYGCIGSIHPKLLLVAERIGPNNVNNIPFETGPTGHMLTDLLAATGTPLNKFAVTNFVKSYRGDSREPNDQDMSLLEIELDHLKPEHIVFMGTVAKNAAKLAKARNIPFTLVPHFGAYSHKGDRSIERYVPEWKKLMGLAPIQAL